MIKRSHWSSFTSWYLVSTWWTNLWQTRVPNVAQNWCFADGSWKAKSIHLCKFHECFNYPQIKSVHKKVSCLHELNRRRIDLWARIATTQHPKTQRMLSTSINLNSRASNYFLENENTCERSSELGHQTRGFTLETVTPTTSGGCSKIVKEERTTLHKVRLRITKT